MLPVPIFGRSASVSTRTPMPPIHWVRLRQNKRPFGSVSKAAKSVAPVVVKPEQDSNSASTGEAKHHELLAAAESGLTLVAAGHFHTEAVVLEPLRLRLRGQFPQVEFQLAEGSQPPSRYV